MTLFVIRKGIFWTRSQDICRFVMANENMISVTRRQNIYSRVCGINRISLTGSRDTNRFICWDKTRFLKPPKSLKLSLKLTAVSKVAYVVRSNAQPVFPRVPENSMYGCDPTLDVDI